MQELLYKDWEGINSHLDGEAVELLNRSAEMLSIGHCKAPDGLE